VAAKNLFLRRGLPGIRSLLKGRIRFDPDLPHPGDLRPITGLGRRTSASVRRMRLGPRLLLGLLAAAAAGLTHGGTIAFKCIRDGQTILKDRPCAPAPVDSSSPSAAPSDSTLTVSAPSLSPVGKWSGQVQYQANENGEVLQAAHTVVPLFAEFTPDGKVTGSSEENGCKLLGIWSQDPQHIVWLDVTLDACRFPGLNRRFGGSLLLAKSANSALLRISATDLPRAGERARLYDIEGTLRR